MDKPVVNMEEAFSREFDPAPEMFVCMDPTGCYHVSWTEQQHKEKMAQVGAKHEARYVSAAPRPSLEREVVATAWKYHGSHCVDFAFAPDPYALERGFLTEIEPLVRQSALIASESRAATAEARLSEAVEVLKPFAEASANLDDSHADGSPIWESPAAMGIEAKHLRAAQSVLDTQGGGNG